MSEPLSPLEDLGAFVEEGRTLSGERPDAPDRIEVRADAGIDRGNGGIDEIGTARLQSHERRELAHDVLGPGGAVEGAALEDRITGLRVVLVGEHMLFDRMSRASSDRRVTKQPRVPAVILKWPIDVPMRSGRTFLRFHGTARLARRPM